MQSEIKPTLWVVSIDIPDPDNFVMAYKMIRMKQQQLPADQPLAIILSPRPVCLSAIPYGEKYCHLLESLNSIGAREENYTNFPTGVRRLASAMTSGSIEQANWIKELDPGDQLWFYTDPDFSDTAVRDDTRLYMKVSALRLVSYLDEHRVPRKDYKLYWDHGSMNEIGVGMRHAFHVPDYTFDFDESKLARYKTLIANNVIDDKGNVQEVVSTRIRQGIIEICEEYISDTCFALKLQEDSVLEDLDSLIRAKWKASTPVKIFVGGPFTEAVKCYDHLRVKQVIGMGGLTDGASNLFPNQFNFHLDMRAAHKTLDLASERKLDLTLLLTESVKNYDYSLSGEELQACLTESAATWKLFTQYYQQSNPLSARYSPFDWALALATGDNSLFLTKHCSKDGIEIIKLKEDPPGQIKILWKKHEDQIRKRYLAALKKTFAIS